jgi:hypothetical protein
MATDTPGSPVDAERKGVTMRTSPPTLSPVASARVEELAIQLARIAGRPSRVTEVALMHVLRDEADRLRARPIPDADEVEVIDDGRSSDS